MTVVVGASCSPDSEETPAADSATTEAVGTTAPAGQTATTAPATTATVVPEPSSTATSIPDTTIAAERALSYLHQLLSSEADIGQLVAEVRAVNNEWDNPFGNGVTYAEFETALEDAVQRAQVLLEAFELIEPPSESGLPNEHQTALTAVRRMPDLVTEMLEGLRSSDTGQARQAGLLKFSAAFNIFNEVIERVAMVIGDEGIAALEGNRAGTTTTQPEDETTTTTTTQPEDETTTTTTQPEDETTTTTTQPEDETTTTTQPEDETHHHHPTRRRNHNHHHHPTRRRNHTTTTTQPEDETTTTTTQPETAAAVTAEFWRPGLAEEVLALANPGSVGADDWSLVEEKQNYGTRSFYRFHFLSTPVSEADGLTEQQRVELVLFGGALTSARQALEQSPIIYYPYRYDIRWDEYPNVATVSAAYPLGETRQIITRRSGASWTADQNVDLPGGPPIRATTPFATPRWADTAGILGRNCPAVEDIWTRGAAVSDSCTLNAIEKALDYLWTESSDLRQRAVRDGHVLTGLFGRLDNQDNAYLAGLYGEKARAGVTTKVRNVRWAGNWAGASMIYLEYQNTQADRELTREEKQDAITYFTGLEEQGISVDSRFLQGQFTMGFAWDWNSTLMVRTADGTWRMSYRSFCRFHRTLNVVDQPQFLCPGDPTPHFPDSDFYDRDLWPPNHVHYYSDPRQEHSPRLNPQYVGVPPS